MGSPPSTHPTLEGLTWTAHLAPGDTSAGTGERFTFPVENEGDCRPRLAFIGLIKIDLAGLAVEGAAGGGLG